MANLDHEIDYIVIIIYSIILDFIVDYIVHYNFRTLKSIVTDNNPFKIHYNGL